jgi:hypothetical protein
MIPVIHISEFAHKSQKIPKQAPLHPVAKKTSKYKMVGKKM